MTPWILLTVAGLAATLALTPTRHVAWTWATKPLASLGFVGLAATGGAGETAFGQAVLAGLLLGMAGDVLLVGTGRGTFLAGLVAFLLGHVAYVVAFALHGLSGPVLGAAGAAVAPVALVLLRWLRPHLRGPMRVAVPVYVAVICAMVATAVACAPSWGGWPIWGGAALFMVSDVLVARNRFVAPGFANRLAGLPLYYAGQLLLAAAARSL